MSDLIERLRNEIAALKLHPATSDEYDAGYIAARNDAFAIVQEAIDGLPAATEALLSIEEKRVQAKRCNCHGSDDYCPCQNAPDAETRRARKSMEDIHREQLARPRIKPSEAEGRE